MNWDWEKLTEQRQRRSGGQFPSGVEEFNKHLNKFKGFRAPSGKLIALIVILIWILSGIYIVEPDEVGVVTRFGAFNRITTSGPHYHIPYPVESVLTPKVTVVRRVEVGFRSFGGERNFQQGQIRPVPEESLMLTGDENIVDVQFIVQYKIKDAVHYLFNISQQAETIKNAAEAAMREVIGHSRIDAALTSGKVEIQNQTLDLMQRILDNYQAGVDVMVVQLQDVHPPAEVIDAFKDVASAREDKSRFINEAEAYRNDILPKTRGEAAMIVNQAQAYKESEILTAQGEASRFLKILAEYNKAKDVTRTRLFIESMERILANPKLEKLILGEEAMSRAVPYLPLDRLPAATQAGGAKQ
ncbi:MAG: modulator of FtsH protease HflK [Desulfovibrionales bacterium]|jgi:membrane protease subunit HflK|nr:modulator of FtsH protease HflK [Desulfovibrionales bacterium]